MLGEGYECGDGYEFEGCRDCWPWSAILVWEAAGQARWCCGRKKMVSPGGEGAHQSGVMLGEGIADGQARGAVPCRSPKLLA